MAHLSGPVYLVWTILTTILGSFLVFHLWSFDRFRCLKWKHGSRSGAFKRVMTYSYILSIPFIITYALGFAIIKYTYGFTVLPEIGLFPTPFELWGQSAQNATFPLHLSLSIGWSLEMVTHLEELCFWLFLVNAGSAHQDWFRSAYFKIWAVGSCIAVLAMPLITIFTRVRVYECEAYTFLTGGLASLSLTISFLPILWTFPSFIESLKTDDIESATLVRLTKYHELNCVRVVFRFLFTLPLVILGVDGVRPHQHINDKLFPTDTLGIIAGIGCVVSSGITLVIFFPRSIEGEIEQRNTRRRQRAQQRFGRWRRTTRLRNDEESYVRIAQQSKTDLDRHAHDPFAGPGPVHSDASVSVSANAGSGLPTYEVVLAPPSSIKRAAVASDDRKSGPTSCVGGSFPLKPNRRTSAGDVVFGMVLSDDEVESERARSKRERTASGLVQQWRSPIEIGRPTVSRWQRQVP